MPFRIDEREKILILGGNTAQIPLIEASRKEGYYVVLCDYTTTNPGIPLADKHYQEDFQNKEKVLEIAKQENVSGVISNSEAAMPVVAYVCENMGLVGNTVGSVQILNSKNEFRDLQKKVGVFSPEHFITESFEEACEKAKCLSYPIIMKPCRSSGSRGTTKILDYDEFITHSKEWEKCSLFSLNRKVVIEEFVEMPDLEKVIDGDIFIHRGHIIWDGLFSSKRSPKEPMLPMTQTFPIILTEDEINEVKATTEKLLKEAGIVFGEFNIELYYGEEKRLFCIEINARQGGNGIPLMVQKHCGIDMYKLLVTTVMGHDEYYNQVINAEREYHYVSRHPVFSHVAGRYTGIQLSEAIKPFVTSIQTYGFEGQVIHRGIMARDKVAMVDLEFPNREIQLQLVQSIEDHIMPQVEEKWEES